MTDNSELPQLVVEVMVRNLDQSLAFYQQLGFEPGRRDGGFAVLQWDGTQLFLDEQPTLPASDVSRANIRIIVPDVDLQWKRVMELGLEVASPIADRSYGLRDFTVLDPDGFGLRFASRLEVRKPRPRIFMDP